MYKLLQKKQGWAIAANQVGIPLRFFVYDFGDGMEVAINPELEEMPPLEDNTFSYREGCLSVPGKFWTITRPDMVKVSYWNAKEEYLEGVVDNIQGRVFQHEIDHLSGVTILDRITQEERESVLEDIRDETVQPIESQQLPIVHPYA